MLVRSQTLAVRVKTLAAKQTEGPMSLLFEGHAPKQMLQISQRNTATRAQWISEPSVLNMSCKARSYSKYGHEME